MRPGPKVLGRRLPWEVVVGRREPGALLDGSHQPHQERGYLGYLACLDRGETPTPFPQWTKSHRGMCVGGCPYQEAPLGPFLLPDHGHLWSLGDLQALVVPSVQGALGIE